MNEEEIAYLAQYCSPYSILVVTARGKLKVLHVPLRVKPIKKVCDFPSNTFQYVEKIMISNSGQTVFYIEGRYYLYSYFDIIVG